MSGHGDTIRGVAGDTGGSYTIQLVDEDTGLPYDLSPPTTRVTFAVELEYATGRRVREIPMAKAVTGSDGLVRLAWAGGELTGALPGTFSGEVRIYTGSPETRYTVFDTLPVEIRIPGAGYWSGS